MKYIITWLFAVTPLYAQNSGVQEKIDQYIQSYHHTGDFSGCILIKQQDSVIYQRCLGQANQAFAIDNTPETKFRIGSISKQLTAVAILTLEEAGKLSTADDLPKYFPNQSIASNITLQQLLTHTSGVVDLFSLPEFASYSSQNLSLMDLAGKILSQPLDFQPGTSYQYSNGGYALLAAIIEQASGMSYANYLEQAVLAPLNMDGSGHANRQKIVNQLAVGYDPLGYQDLKTAPYIDYDLLQGSGSLFSTLGDMVKWIEALRDRKLLSNDSWDKFFNNYGHNYGYGISIYRTFGKKVFGHDGRINGFIADYLYYLEEDLSIIILGNVQSGVADFLRRDLAAILFKEEYQSRAKQEPPAEAYPSDVKDCLGAYAFGPNFTVYLEMIDNKVMARANEGGYSEMVFLQNGQWFSRVLYSYIDLQKDPDGNYTKMIWINNDGNRFEGLKK